MKTDVVYQGNCLERMGVLPEKSVDLIFLDPPYNLQIQNSLKRPDNSSVHGVLDAWDHFNSLQEYDDFSKAYLTKCKRLLKDSGSLWIMGTYHNIYRLGSMLQDLGFWILNDIVWIKSNPMPNFLGRRFTNAHETLLWCSKSKDAAYTFHYKSLKALNDNLQMRSDWYLPICTGKERLKDSKGQKVHSTQKPESLLYRILLGTSSIGDVVLDPFAGTGTTLAVAKKLHRHYVGIEQEETYVKVIRKRLRSIQKVDLESVKLPTAVRPARVPFGSLLERGLLQPGDTLYNKSRSIQALILSDGNLKIQDKWGSIHQMGAYTSNTESCNGWTYWYYNDISIDYFRNEIRQNQQSS